MQNVKTKELLIGEGGVYTPRSLIVFFSTTNISVRKVNRLLNSLNNGYEHPVMFKVYQRRESNEMEIGINLPRLLKHSLHDRSCVTDLGTYLQNVVEEAKIFSDTKQLEDAEKLMSFCMGSNPTDISAEMISGLHDGLNNSLLIGRYYAIDGLISAKYENYQLKEAIVEPDFAFIRNFFCYSGKLPTRKTVSFVCAADVFDSTQLSVVTDSLNDAITDINSSKDQTTLIELPNSTEIYKDVLPYLTTDD